MLTVCWSKSVDALFEPPAKLEKYDSKSDISSLLPSMALVWNKSDGTCGPSFETCLIFLNTAIQLSYMCVSCSKPYLSLFSKSTAVPRLC